MARIRANDTISRKETITVTAARLFREKGFAATTMRELAESVGVEAPSLYNHIGSKGELLSAICAKVGESFTTHLKTITASELGPVAKLEELIRFHIRMMQEHFAEVYVANHDWKHLRDAELKLFLRQRKNYEEKLIALVKAGIDDELLRPIDPHVAVLTILSAVRGLEFWQRHRQSPDAHALEENMLDHLLYGLVKK
jgi:AcrR family transcriptional regulator